MAFDNIKSIIAVHSGKGGVGKSTLTVNLATSLAAKGARVGLLDADVHGPSATIMLGNGEWPDPGKDENTIHPVEAHGVKFISMGNIVTKETPLIWRGAMVHSVLAQFLNNVLWGELDYLFIDMPPGTGDAQLSIAQTVPLTGVIVVSTPQELSLADTIRGISGFRRMKVPILGVIENMSHFVCDNCGDSPHLFGDSGAEALAEELNFPVLAKVPLDGAICEASDKGTPFVISHSESATAHAINGAITRLLQTLESNQPSKTYHLEWKELGWDAQRVTEPPEEIQGNGPLKAMWQISSDELGLLWADGKKKTISVRTLRLACPCAACIDEWTGKPLLNPDTVPADISLKEIKTVGRYALNPIFSDGHKSGLYHFDRLKAMK